MTDGLQIEGLVFDRRGTGGDFVLDQDVMAIPQGSLNGILGPSGCGKSTLLDIIALILRPTRLIRMTVTDRQNRSIDLTEALLRGSANQLAHWRARLVGYVLQTGGLVPFATVRDNIALPRLLLGMPDTGIVASLARRLGIEDLLERWPARLSVGQRQRVAVARALAHEPPLIIADEPTASLDPANGDAAMDLLIDACREYGATLIVSTHDRERAIRFGLQTLVCSVVDGRTRFS